MRAQLALLVVLAVAGWTQAAPANLHKLEDLKVKLRALEGVLEDLNQNIDRLETKDEKREMVPVPPEVQQPDSDTASFINSLSPEDKEALEKMKSKMNFLQGAVHDGPGVDVPAKDGFSEEQPLEEEPAKRGIAEEERELIQRQEEELESFVSRLSDDDKALLSRMKSKLGNLRTAIEAEKKNEAVSEVKERLMSDISYAKDNGISLKNVLRSLVEARRNQQ